MTTDSAALDMVGEPGASDLLERNIDLLTVSQRRFLIHRIESTTDADALRQARLSSTTMLAEWRKKSPIFERIYLAAKRSTPEEQAAISNMRFSYIAGKCLSLIEEFVGQEPDPANVGDGTFPARERQATFALNVLKEFRTRASQMPRKNAKPSTLSAGVKSVEDLTREAMKQAGDNEDAA